MGDFQSDELEVELESEAEPESEVETELAKDDFELPDLELDEIAPDDTAAEEIELEPALEEAPAGVVSDFGELEIEAEEGEPELDDSLEVVADDSDEETEVEAVGSHTEGMVFATDGDEIATKLDLARAYMDMGDHDGARAILEEVLQEGTDSQKQEAQSLIDSID